MPKKRITVTEGGAMKPNYHGVKAETLERTTEANGTTTEKTIKVTRPDIRIVKLTIEGNAPYYQHRFSVKAMTMMKEKHEKGSQAKKEKTRTARNFEEDCENATYRGPKDQYGIPAAAFRAGLIGQCRLIGFAMTLAKLSLFVEHDFFDKLDFTPLVAIEGEPEMSIMPVRNATGVADLRSRPMWKPGWKAQVRVKYDADQFSETDVVNLFVRLGIQGGIGDGRPNSKSSCGCGWGTFDVIGGQS